MTAVVMLSVAALLSAAPQAGVVLVKRSGVNRALALARAEQVKQALGTDVNAGTVEDLTSCSGRLPCLVKSGRDHGWASMVLVETANILGEAIVDVRLISVDDDGKELARANAQVAEAQLSAVLPAKLVSVRDALKHLAGPAPEPPPVAVIEKPVEVVPPPPTPPPAVVVSPAPAPAARPATRWIPFAGSLAITVAGSICFGVSRGIAAELTTDPLTDPEIDALVSSGKTFSTLGLGGLIGGGVLTVASLVLALAWPETTVQPTALLLPGGGAIGLVGVFP